MDKLIINDVELELDMSDADVLELLTTELPACVEKCTNIKDANSSEIEKIKKLCLAVRTSLIKFFGDDKVYSIIPHPNSLDECMNAWQSFSNQLEIINKAKVAEASKIEKAAVKLAKSKK